MNGPVRTLVIMPTYNERESLPRVLESLLGSDGGYHILVVDDGSPDQTADWVRGHPAFGNRLHLIERTGKLGLGSAYIEGFKQALADGYDIAVQMDADGSHDPADVPLLVQAVVNGADMAVGSRYLGGVRVLNWSIERLLLSITAGVYVRAWLGIPCSDPTSGFKAIHRRYLEKMDFNWFKSQGYGMQIELVFTAWQSALRLVEVPIIFTERRQGSSKMNMEIAIEAVLRVPRLRLTALSGGKPWLRPVPVP